MDVKKCSRRDFLKAVSVAAASSAFTGCLGASQPVSHGSGGKKPNIIIILADDLGYGDLSCYGSKIINTPNIDALAAGGLRFTDFHSNGPMCSPTRASLLTGRYQQRCGIEGVLSGKSNYDTGMALKEVTFAEVLKQVGYTSGCFGKWHLGYKPTFNPVRQGFDTYRGFVAGGSDYFSHVDRSGRPDWWKDDKLFAEKGYTTNLLTDHAIELIEANHNKPFCVYLPYQSVHFPFQGPNDQADRSVGGSYWSKAKYGRRYEDVEDRKAAYKEMTESMDANVGRIVDKVRQLGIEKDTLIFFASDNGAYSWVGTNLPCSGQKTELLEGGHRVPAIAYWPGTVKGGTVTDETVMTMDLFPTMVEMTKAPMPKELKLDGVSILSLLTRNKPLPRRTLFWRFRKQSAVRKGPWKLYVKGQQQHLYNLTDDIGEKNDLAAQKPDMVAALRAEYLAWEKNVTTGVKWIRK